MKEEEIGIATQDPFHALPISEAFKRLKTSNKGLTHEEVKNRLLKFGKNTLHEEKIHLFTIFIRQFQGIPIYILFAASLVSIFIGEWLDCLVIIGIIIINGVIGFWQECKAEASIAALKKMTESKNRVIRDGEYFSIPSSELVPGDYMIFQEGEVITADVRLTDSTGLMIDESSLTGESVPVIKNHDSILEEKTLPYELSNMLLAGTVVVRGRGHGVIVRTGNKTYLASVAEKAQESSPATPLNKALKFFMKRFILILIAIFILIWIVGFFQGRNIIDLSYILLAGLVSAVPEGFPVVITLVMVLGAMALSKKQTLIRYLPSVETLGSVTVIASDKTGTITEGKLKVAQVFTNDIKKLKITAALCNDAKNGSGDPLDIALSKWIENYEEIRKDHPRIWEHPFDTRLMFMASINQMDGSEQLFIKGAFEALKEKALNAEMFTTPLKDFLEQGLRVIAFGQGKWEKNPDLSSWKIEIIGLIGFLDPPKKDVKESVISAKKAGIKVIMITGDHPMTAKAVAKEAHIWSEGDEILIGKEIETLSDGALLTALKKVTVLARVLPEHKYRIVKLLQNNTTKEIVAVTGDGVNDVPALKAADIGIAMGSGAEAAKGVSKMVITDNNLRIIVDAIKNARIIADNIRKVIYYLVSTTLQELALIVLSIVSNQPLPLIAIQILWINLIGDGVQDKTFPFAKEEGNVMRRKPKSIEKQFFDLAQIIRIFVFGATVAVLSFFLYIYLLKIYEKQMVSTIIFTSVVVAQWANGIQSQKEREPFFKNIRKSFSINPYIYLGIAIGAIMQCIIIYWIPYLFHLTPIGLAYWKYPLWIFLAAFGIVEIRKWVEIIFFHKGRDSVI